jgi:signal transduction histidine kinase
VSTVIPAAAGVDHPSLVPADLVWGAGGRRRSVRDWIVDVMCFLLAGSLGAATFLEGLSRVPPAPDALVAADLVAGTLACLALWWRRRWPVGIAVAVGLVGVFSDAVAGAVVISVFTVAVHRRWPALAAVTALHVATFLVYARLRPAPDLSYVVNAAISVTLMAAVVAWGMFVRARRQLVQSLRERALRAEYEQELRAEQARQMERTRIAREMHDVLAHRISLLSMHAGALEFRPDAPPDEMAKAAGVIRQSAHQALQDLREVIGVLRAPDGLAGRPQPTLADLPALVEESRQAGAQVRADYRVDLGTVPTAAGRNAYRIVQEGLTNARKHAWGTAVTVVVDGAPGSGLSVEVRNRLPVGGDARNAIPGGGTGLVGLGERVSLAGGRLEHGRTPDGDFRLRAELPWPA